MRGTEFETMIRNSKELTKTGVSLHNYRDKKEEIVGKTSIDRQS